MKKVISVVIATVIAISSFVMAFAAPLQEERESKELNGFINGITELAREYDKGKDFVVPENDETAQIQLQPFSAQSTVDATDNNTEQEYTLHDFQTARLIVRTNGKFNKHGALEDISGFDDFHILQYESPEEAMSAYTDLQAEKNITNVAPDEVVAPLQGEKVETLTASEISEKDYLCDWSVDRTQSKRLQEYLAKSDIPMEKVVVGVIDTGVDYNHEFLKDRIVRTNFNSSSDGTPNDEMDNEYECHGTAVSSVIVDNSPKNISVAVYRVLNDDGSTTTSQICAGYLRAIKDSVDIINVSLGHNDESGMAEACIMQAYSCNIPIFTAIGNVPYIDISTLPAGIAECIIVSATDKNNTTVSWNTLSKYTDISAPGEDIPVAVIHNGYEVWSGTSFSAPCAVALGAILKSVNPEITVDEIEAQLKETSIDVEKYNSYESAQGNALDNYHSLLDGVGMIQFCNALGLEKLTAPVLNLEDKVYVGEQSCTITCEDKNATVLYTTDGTYPDFENANVYTEPFQVTKCTRIRAVAYYADGGYYSDEAEATPRIQYTDSDDNFVIDESGSITKYKGSISDLYVPETINGITVTGFSKGAFNTVIGLTLPDTMTEIPESAFIKNTTLEFIYAKGVLNIGNFAFYQSDIRYCDFPKAINIGRSAFELTLKFYYANFPSAEYIGRTAFMNSGLISFDGPNVKIGCNGMFQQSLRLESVRLPQCTTISRGTGVSGEFYEDNHLFFIEMPLVENLFSNSFYGTNISIADFPCIKEINTKAFCNCMCLEYINMPMLLTVPKQAFGNGPLFDFDINASPRFFCLDSVTQIEQDAFGEYPTSRIEFSHLETAQSLPQTEGCIIAMPSTFKECTVDTKGRNYKVYGTKGTYAEQWAIENGHEFIEISQDTAVLTQLPEQYTDADDVLTADVIGFNRTYQWYASDKPDNTAGTPINGATDREFNPADYPAAKYYYCVVTSTDVGYDPIEIRTGVTENTTLNLADYSKVEKAKSEIPEDLSVYTDESVKALQDILDNIDYSLDETEQNKVDDYAKAIEEAINALEYKPADYTEYNKAVEKANALDRSLYQDLTALDNALSVDVSGKNITEQSVVDKQTKVIEEAINSLEYKPADYTEYNKAVEKAESLDRNLYQDLTALDVALNVDVSGKNITEQAVVDEQTKAIEEAINSLEYKPADYTEYNKAVERANALDRSLYQDLTALDVALNVDVSGKSITEQTVVDEQTKAIEEAINSLEYKPADYSKLNSALAQVPEDLSIYTDESVKRLNSVIESLNYNLNVTQQDEADKQVEALLEAINSLEKRYILGDVNLDGEITILDAKWVLQNIVRLRSLGGLSLKAADMNQDGKITILDARLILFAVTR